MPKRAPIHGRARGIERTAAMRQTRCASPDATTAASERQDAPQAGGRLKGCRPHRHSSQSGSARPRATERSDRLDAGSAALVKSGTVCNVASGASFA
jgi:hypothetical protein